jgi:sugar phosphate isomerase/epimerase
MDQPPAVLTRRALLSAAASWGIRGPVWAARAEPEQRPIRWRIGVSDLMLLKRQKLGALPLAHEIGADGVEVDMGGLGLKETWDNKLTDPAVRKQFMDTAAAQNINFCSLAMTGFFAQSFARRNGVERMVQDCLDTARLLGVRVVFLPLGVGADLTKNPELRPIVVERLRSVAPRAAEAKVIIGIESSLSARDEAALLDAVGSPFVRSYFNFSNAVKAERDVCDELETLGKSRICQIHCTDGDGVWLQDDPKIDLHRIKKTLDALNWTGWLVMERSRRADDPQNVRRNFGANATYLKSIFQAG